MNDEEIRGLLREALSARYLVIALTQLLVESGVLKGTEAEVLEMLEAWAKDLQQDDANQLWIDERVRTLREAWKKLPKQ